ncbi:hypothetical protein PCE1_004756 [Barthelona sp. PCE]
MSAFAEQSLYDALEQFQINVVLFYEEKFQNLGITLSVDVLSFVSNPELLDKRLLSASLLNDIHPISSIYAYLYDVNETLKSQGDAINHHITLIRYAFAQQAGFEYSQLERTVSINIELSFDGFITDDLQFHLNSIFKLKEQKVLTRTKRSLAPLLEEKLSIGLSDTVFHLNIDFASYLSLKDPTMRLAACQGCGSASLFGHVPSSLIYIAHDSIGKSSILSSLRHIVHKVTDMPEHAGFHIDYETKTLTEVSLIVETGKVDLALSQLNKDVYPYAQVKEITEPYSSAFFRSFKIEPFHFDEYRIINFKYTSFDFTSSGYIEQKFHMFPRRRIHASQNVYIPAALEQLTVFDVNMDIVVDYDSFLNIQDAETRKLALQGLGSEWFALRVVRLFRSLHEAHPKIPTHVNQHVRTYKIEYAATPSCTLDLQSQSVRDVVSIVHGEWSTSDIDSMFDRVFFVGDLSRLFEIEIEAQQQLKNELEGILKHDLDIDIDKGSFLALRDDSLRMRAVEYIPTALVTGRIAPSLRKIYESSDFEDLITMVTSYRLVLGVKPRTHMHEPVATFEHRDLVEIAEPSIDLDVLDRMSRDSLPNIVLVDTVCLDESGIMLSQDPYYPIRYGHLLACAMRTASIVSSSHMVDMRESVGFEGPSLNLFLSAAFRSKFVNDTSLSSVDFLERLTGPLNPVDYSEIVQKPGAFVFLSDLFLTLAKSSSVFISEIRRVNEIKLLVGEANEVAGTTITKGENIELIKVTKNVDFITYFDEVRDQDQPKELTKALNIYFGPEVLHNIRAKLEQVIVRELRLVEQETIERVQNTTVPELKRRLNDALGLEGDDVWDLDVYIDWRSILILPNREQRVGILEAFGGDMLLGRLLAVVVALVEDPFIDSTWLASMLRSNIAQYNVCLLSEHNADPMLCQEPQTRMRETDEGGWAIDDFSVLDVTSRQMEGNDRRSIMLGEFSDIPIPIKYGDIGSLLNVHRVGVHRIMNKVNTEMLTEVLYTLAHAHRTVLGLDGTVLQIADAHSLIAEVDWDSFMLQYDSDMQRYSRFVNAAQIDDCVFEGVLIALQTVYGCPPDSILKANTDPIITATTSKRAKKDSLLRGISISCGPPPLRLHVDRETRVLIITSPFLEPKSLPSPEDIVTVLKQWLFVEQIAMGDSEGRLRILKETLSLRHVRNGNLEYVESILDEAVFHRSPCLCPHAIMSQFPLGIVDQSMRLVGLHKIRGMFDTGRLRIFAVQPQLGELVIYRPPPRLQESLRLPLSELRGIAVGLLSGSEHYALEIITSEQLPDNRRLVFSLLTTSDEINSYAAVLEITLMILAASGASALKNKHQFPFFDERPSIEKPSGKVLGIF